MRLAVVLSMIVVAACGGSGSHPIDAALGVDDIFSIDAARVDAPTSAIDAPQMSMTDASTDPCGVVGTTCADNAQCGAGMQCYIGGGGGVCAPDRSGCGGFANAMCGAAAPQCHYLTGGDYGPCLTVAEEMCVCSRAMATVQGCP
jgi:hypothetical protein